MSQTDQELGPSLDHIASAASDQTTRSRAIDLAIKALGKGQETPLVLALVSEGLEQDGRLIDAAALAHRATDLFPRSAEAWMEFSRLLQRLGERSQAAEAAAVAAEIEPESFAARMNAAAAFLGLNAFAEAAEHARSAAALRPLAPEPLSTLAVVHARASEFSEARLCAESALRLRRDLPGAEIALARVEIAESSPDLATLRLRRILGGDLHDSHRAEALSVLGDALDDAGAPGKAFASYAASNAVMAHQADAARARGARRAVEHAAILEAYFRSADRAAWRSGAGDDSQGREAEGHVFLVGFPRSGTTLLENALAGHPRVLALEETNALALCAGDLMADGPALERLARLSAEQADDCRAIYWRRVAELVREPLSGKVVVDKLPIGTVALPVITKLFPNALILFARRDPRDVTLSCFRRLFGTNEVMAEFLTLEEAAHYYDQVMRLAALYEEVLPLQLHVVRHEDVVADFDSALGKALAFIGLDWDPVVRSFTQRAIRARTPSATQLADGLNDKGVGAWHRFERQMSPVLPILEPWAERFGYPPARPDLLAPPDDRLAPIREEVTKALGVGDWPTVFARTDQAFADGFTDPMLLRIRGIRAQREDRLESAIADFETALVDAPGDVGLLSAVGLCLARLGRGADALARLDEAIALDPKFAPAHFNRGFTLENLGDLAGARAAYGRAIDLDPRNAPALGSLAVLASRAADWRETKEYAVRALAIAPGLPSASLALAAAEAAQGEEESAESRLRALVSGQASAHEKAVAQATLGDVMDRSGRHREAFTAYEAAAAGLFAIHGGRFEASGRERASSLISRLAAWFEATDSAAWAPQAGNSSSPSAFLLGFPRSGTTVLGQALTMHPELFTLEEHDTLADSISAFYGEPAGLARLENLGPADAAAFRQAYFDRAHAGGWPEDVRMLIDKLPTNTMGLPIIAKVVPGARILMMHRDPRDVVLSCFRRQFAINPTTIEFLTLASTAKLYDAVMELFFLCRKKLKLNIRVQSYEVLVGDFETEMRAILSFLGHDWNPVVADFGGRARSVATPSSAQLARGLSAEGIGAWRAYRFALEPVLPILSPWVQQFGYPAE